MLLIETGLCLLEVELYFKIFNNSVLISEKTYSSNGELCSKEIFSDLHDKFTVGRKNINLYIVEYTIQKLGCRHCLYMGLL